ncbi:hypothetical protein C8R47DRAFT_1072021 [Mycena vitilis]|nr:hypothetical protein C8R47DRAFT_1084899 [Mycena vitilis]KAJ6487360.1 hypothetical protein C8R47DRAFT_1072021 [Mycena vitilis]
MCPRRWSPPTARPPPPPHRLAAAGSPLLLINMAITIALALGADGGRDERRGPNLLKIRRHVVLGRAARERGQGRRRGGEGGYTARGLLLGLAELDGRARLLGEFGCWLGPFRFRVKGWEGVAGSSSGPQGSGRHECGALYQGGAR